MGSCKRACADEPEKLNPSWLSNTQRQGTEELLGPLAAQLPTRSWPRKWQSGRSHTAPPPWFSELSQERKLPDRTVGRGRHRGLVFLYQLTICQQFRIRLSGLAEPPSCRLGLSGSRIQLSIDWADHVRLELARDAHPGRVRGFGSCGRRADPDAASAEHGFDPGRTASSRPSSRDPPLHHHRLAGLRRHGKATAGLRPRPLSWLSRGAGRPTTGRTKERSFPVVACGHAAGYTIDLEARHPGTFTHLVLIAPTWRGPLPTMMSGRKPIQGRIRRLIYAPRHRRAALPAESLPAGRADDVPKTRVRRSRVLDRRPPCRSHPSDPQARRPLCFGLLRHRRPRPIRRPGVFLAAARCVPAPMLMLYGPDTPPRSRAEMEALADLPGIESRLLGRGTLGMAEELAGDLAPLIDVFYFEDEFQSFCTTSLPLRAIGRQVAQWAAQPPAQRHAGARPIQELGGHTARPPAAGNDFLSVPIGVQVGKACTEVLSGWNSTSGRATLRWINLRQGRGLVRNARHSKAPEFLVDRTPEHGRLLPPAAQVRRE